jgi:hypothetical protein
MTVKYGSGQTTYVLDPNNINTQIKYIGNSLSSRGNILTLNESSDLLPTPQIIYLNTD